jgi:2-haloacid dehalogenase
MNHGQFASFGQFRAISFDCYGTLIDWQSGLLAALRPRVAALGLDLTDNRIVEMFAAFERRIEAGPYVPYREVLRRVAREILGDEAHAAAVEALPESLGNWMPFADTNPALERFARRYALAIVSNVDNDQFALTRERLAAPLAAVVTAQEVRSYKPGEAHFRELLSRLGLPAEQVLHVAESRYHDVEPAGGMGFGTVWINRTGAAPSASGPGRGEPMWTFDSLASFADAALRHWTRKDRP